MLMPFVQVPRMFFSVKHLCTLPLAERFHHWSGISFFADLTVPDPCHVLSKTHIEGETVYCLKYIYTEMKACDMRQRQLGKPSGKTRENPAHLTNNTIMQSYKSTGDIGKLKP